MYYFHNFLGTFPIVSASLYLTAWGYAVCGFMALASIRLGMQWQLICKVYDDTVFQMQVIAPPPDLRRRHRVISALTFGLVCCNERNLNSNSSTRTFERGT